VSFVQLKPLYIRPSTPAAMRMMPMIYAMPMVMSKKKPGTAGGRLPGRVLQAMETHTRRHHSSFPQPTPYAAAHRAGEIVR